MIKGINTYSCNTCREVIVTIDREEGTTPMTISCVVTKECLGMMYSAWYRVDQILRPAYEWYKPANLKGLNSWTRIM